MSVCAHRTATAILCQCVCTIAGPFSFSFSDGHVLTKKVLRVKKSRGILLLFPRAAVMYLFGRQ